MTDSHTKNNSQNDNDDNEVTKAIRAAAEMGNQPPSDAAPDTIFGKIGRGEIPCDTVYEDETTLAFRDLNPQSPVHIIVIPKLRNGLTGLRNASPSQEGVLGHLLFVAGQVGKVHCPDGFRIVINDGKEGSQSVYHLHLHVLGGRQMQWPPG
jgi:histidine triad (HIT) family protein